MVARVVFILVAALVSIALADQAQLKHTERIKLCQNTPGSVLDPDCANICPRPCDPGYVCQSGVCLPRSHICPHPCGAGYFCQRGVCVDRCLTIKCKSGHQCIRGQCRKVMGCGQRCDPKWICAPGLSCINSKCTGPTVGENGTCGVSSCNRCKTGTRCYEGKCRKEMGCYESCYYPRRVCGLKAICKQGRCQCRNPCGDNRIIC